MKQISLIVLIFISINTLTAQNNSIRLRHMEGFKSIKIGGALSLGENAKTNTILLGYNHYLNKKMFIGADLNYESGEINYSKIKNPSLKVYFNYSLLSFNNTYFINVVGGAFGGIESLESEVMTQSEEMNSFIGGALLGFSSEIFLTNTICLEPFILQYWQSGSQIGSSFNNIGLSLKINF